MNRQDKTTHPYQALKNLGKERLGELGQLAKELFKHMNPAELATLLFPPALGLDMLSFALAGKKIPGGGFDPNYPDKDLLEAVLKMAEWWSTHYFKTTIDQINNLPADKPALIVGNHSAGLMPLDALFAMNKIRAAHGKDKIVHPLVHDFAYAAPKVANISKRMGILRASNNNALDALAAGHHVLVYPGGDKDAFRTFFDRSRIVLANRKGFIKLAIKAQVSIVPLVSVGLHESFFVFYNGEKLAKKFGLKNLIRTEVMPMAFSLPWGLAPAFFPFMPVPTSIEMRFCKPVDVIKEAADINDDQAINRIYNKVESSMQTTMDELSANRVPFFGR